MRNKNLKLGDKIKLFRTPLNNILPNPVYKYLCTEEGIGEIVNIQSGAYHWQYDDYKGSFNIFSEVELYEDKDV